MKGSKVNLLVNSTLALGVTLLCLLLVEFTILPVWATGGLHRDLALLGFYATPNSTVGDTPINADGFTGTELSALEASTEEINVLTLGGSTLFNRRMTERMLSNWQQMHGANWTVTGGALRTHTTRASLIKYQEIFSHYDFDYVVIYHGVNDLWTNNVPAADFRTDYSHMQPWYKRNILLENSLVARYLYNGYYRGTGVFPRDNINAADFASNATFESNLQELIAAIRANGATPILMSFAWHIPENYSLDGFKAYEVGYNNPTHYDECPVELWGTTSYVRAGLNLHNQTLRKLARNTQTHLIDLDSYLSGNIENFGDVVHLSDIGTDRLVERVGRELGVLAADALD
ncbi:MAG: GDSL-type esterase/lipase family protein [Pseudomonadales bacterium]